MFADREFNIPSRRQSKSTALRPRRDIKVGRRAVGCTCREASGNSAVAGWGNARGSHASGTAKGDRGRCGVLPPLPFLRPARRPLACWPRASHAWISFFSPKPSGLDGRLVLHFAAGAAHRYTEKRCRVLGPLNVKPKPAKMAYIEGPEVTKFPAKSPESSKSAHRGAGAYPWPEP